ncbi:MAG TPA: TetR/AcrR family transcriptional regulator [Candidatus Yaniella excrementigallinarum]|nr:TetR/AcrR family transcriptional regulator [Candidatus Yaniella excrementigallinarum]
MSTQITPAARMPRDQRRAQLINVALDVFAHHGFAQTTMDEIARQAAISKPVLYQHFENKRGLYFTLLDHQFQVLRNVITTRMQSIDPTAANADEQTAYQAVYGVFEFTSEPGGHYRLMLDSSMDNPEERQHRMDEFLNELVEFISPYVLENSSLDPATSRFITSGIASTVLYLACRWAEEYRDDVAAREQIPFDAAVETTYQFVAHGALGFDLSNNPSA